MKLFRNPLFQRNHSAFTLIELLAVIAIIAILATIIIPSVGKIRESAERAKSQSNIRSIAQAYAAYSTSGGRIRVIPASTDSIHAWAGILAAEVGLNDASLYFIDTDPLVAEMSAIPLLVGAGVGQGFSLNTEFLASRPSYAVVAGLAPNAPTTTTPLIFTRGLTDAGTWNPSSPWGGEGGHIGFLDGHVRFFRDLSSEGGMLVNYTSQTRTANIQQAISPGAVILNNE